MVPLSSILPESEKGGRQASHSYGDLSQGAQELENAPGALVEGRQKGQQDFEPSLRLYPPAARLPLPLWQFFASSSQPQYYLTRLRLLSSSPGNRNGNRLPTQPCL